AEGYRTFVQNYQQYWPRYFDPIGVELSTEPGHIRLSTCILPLIESSAYRQLQRLARGAPRQWTYGRGSYERLGGVFSIKLTPFDGYKSDLSHIEDPQLRQDVLEARRSVENWLPWGTDKDVFSWIGPEAGLVVIDSDVKGLERLEDAVG